MKVGRAAYVSVLSISLAATAVCGRAWAFDEAAAAAERLLGRADEAQAVQSLLLFRRQASAQGVLTGSLADSTALAGVPAAAMLEADRALANVIDPERDLRTCDRFAVRWEQEFTIDNQPVGVARVLTIELYTARKGTVALSRFRSITATAESFYLADGRLAGPPPIGEPLERMQVTSGFGLRPDPLDQPERVAPVVAPPKPQPAPPAAAPQRTVEDRKEIAHAYAGFIGVGQLGSASDVGGRNRELDRVMAERRVRAREQAAREKAEKEAAEAAAAEKAAQPSPPPAQPAKPVLLYMHEGLDLLANIGTPIHAAADGIVTLARPDRGYGNAVHIAHADGLSTIYAHLSRFAPGVVAGSRVMRGEVIGFVGSTGRSTGAHLHFEVLVHGHPVNPATMFQAPRLAAFDLARFKRQVAFERQERAQELAHADGAPAAAVAAIASLAGN